jgi:hypothetical protein
LAGDADVYSGGQGGEHRQNSDHQPGP